MFKKKSGFKGCVVIVSFFCFLSVTGCTARKQLVTKQNVADNTSKAIAKKMMRLDSIREAQNKFETFSGKARGKINFNGSNYDVTLNIRIKNGEKIWVSVTAFAGIEAARVLITPDSIMLLNKLQNVLVKKPFSYITAMAGKQVNYKTLEALMVGNAAPEFINEKTALQLKGDTTILTGNLDSLAYMLKVGPTMKVTRTNLINQTANESVKIVNDLFMQVGSRLFATQIGIESTIKARKIKVTLHYVKFDFDQPLEFPFKVPDGYSEPN